MEKLTPKQILKNILNKSKLTGSGFSSKPWNTWNDFIKKHNLDFIKLYKIYDYHNNEMPDVRLRFGSHEELKYKDVLYYHDGLDSEIFPASDVKSRKFFIVLLCLLKK